MKAQGALIQGGLAAVALGAAFVTWQRPVEQGNEEAVVVVDASKSTLERVHFEDGKRFVDLFKDSEGRPMVTQGPLATAEPVDAGTIDAGQLPDGGAVLASVPPPPSIPLRTMRGSELAKSVLERFAPFKAQRALGVQSAEKQKEFGLQGRVRALEFHVGGATRKFRVSDASAGLLGTYVQDVNDQKVFLLTSGALAELDPNGQALIERKLHTFRLSEADEFTVTQGSKSKTYLVKEADIAQTVKIAPKDAPDKPDEFVRNWHDKVWQRLIVTEVLGQGEAPTAGTPQVQFRVEYTFRGSKKGWVELATVGESMFARSENTAGWVALHTGGTDLLTEAKKVVGGL